MEVIVQIEQSLTIEQIPTIYKTPVWKYLLWAEYQKHLPFMADESNYSTTIISIGGIVIDFISYLRVESKEDCVQYEMTWFLEENVLYIHFKGHNPPYVLHSFKNGILYGFTDREPAKIGNLQYLPDLLQIPDIEESADILKYSRMKFLSGSVQINNSNGENDGILSVFGNNLNVFLRNGDAMDLIYQYYISKYSIDSKTATFTCKDRREKLSFSCPNSNYSALDFPFIDSKYEGKIIQDAYGKCKNIPGVCLNVGEIYNDPYSAGTFVTDYNNWFTFKFARTITSIETIEAKMRDEDGNDLWVEVYPGLGIREYKGLSYKNDFVYKYQANNPNKPVINYAEGTVKIWWANALKPNTGHLFGRGGDANEVRATGVFNPQTNPGEIVRDMLMYYGQYQYDSSIFNMTEWTSELSTLSEIGIFLDSKKSVYEWIEKIQNGCSLGWQMFILRDRFTARLDDPNRRKSFDIDPADIENMSEIEVELDGENYASYTDVSYRPDYTEKNSNHVIDKSMQNKIMDIYHFENGYENDSLLWNEADAKRKGYMILEDFSVVRPILRGIRLRGTEWFNLRIYDIGMISFTIELPERLKALQPFLKDRRFMGRLRCQIIGKKISLKDETVVIDVRQRDRIYGVYADFCDSIFFKDGQLNMTIAPKFKDTIYAYDAAGNLNILAKHTDAIKSDDVFMASVNQATDRDGSSIHDEIEYVVKQGTFYNGLHKYDGSFRYDGQITHYKH